MSIICTPRSAHFSGRKSRWLKAALSAIVLSGCSITGQQPFSDPPPQLQQQVPANRASAVFLRDKPQGAAPASLPISVFLNGKYLASLPAGTWQQTLLCPREQQRVTAAFVAPGSRHAVKQQQGAPYRMPLGTASYYLLSGTPGQPVTIREMPAEEAQRLAATLAPQSRIQQRINEDARCDAASHAQQ